MAATNPRQRLRLGDLLVEHKVISETQLQQALTDQKKSGRKLGRVLIENGVLDEDALLSFLSQQLSIPHIDLRDYPLKPEVIRLIPETYARRYRALALRETGEGILVGMTDPTDIFAFDELVRLLKRPVEQAVVKERDLLQVLDNVYQRSAQIQNLAGEVDLGVEDTPFEPARTETDDAPVARLIQTLFEEAVTSKASDIHVEPGEDVLRIRRRVDGALHEQVMEEKRIAPAIVSRLKLMAGLDIAERRLPQDGRFNHQVGHRTLDVRLSTMPTQYGETVVMRLLDHSSGILNLEELGMPDHVLERFRRAIHRPYGLVLVTGPTGSGKTTTLYAALSELNGPGTKIVTVEDPIEYRLPRVNQVQVNARIGLDFARVLRTALRHDPDIILLGEMRDRESAEIGMRAALTGHLVLSTLHTNDAASAPVRLIDMGVPGYLVAACTHAVLAQRLIRRICRHCVTDHEPDDHQSGWLRSAVGDKADRVQLKRGTGCNYCGRTGYSGRVGVYELLELGGESLEALRHEDHNAFHRAVEQHRRGGTLLGSALRYAAQGITTIDEVMRVSGTVE